MEGLEVEEWRSLGVEGLGVEGLEVEEFKRRTD